MKQYLHVVNSDSVNRYNMLFTLSALHSALDVSWDVGVPMHLSHDMHRLIGWSRAFGIHLEPGWARLTGLSYFPENDQERSQVSALANRHWSRLLDRAVQSHVPELEERLRTHLSGNQKPSEADCAALVDAGLAVRAFPEVFCHRDKDGLVLLSGLTPVAAGVFEKDGLLLFAHPYLRRSLSRRNGLNTPFLGCLQAMRTEPGLVTRIALDEDLVGLASTFHEHFELAYWWGPKFTNNLGEISLGITHHEATDSDRRFHGISRTEFRWYAQNEAKTFECEELQDLPSLGVGDDTYGCRFVHSRVDPATGLPDHLDGAIRMYDEESMVKRLECDIYHFGRRSRYRKLWRVDGPLPVSTWKELIAHYFRDNKLVGEYFGGVDARSEIARQPSAPESSARPHRLYAPTSMERGDGIRIHVCYLEKPEEPRELLEIQVLDWLNYGEQRYDFIESAGVEIIKLLRRGGHSAAVPQNVVRLAFEDRVVNLPLVVHTGTDAVTLARATLVAIGQLCGTWLQRGGDRLVSFALRIDYGERDVLLSVAGHIEDVCKWLSQSDLVFPVTGGEWNAWLDATYTALNRTFPLARDIPPLGELLETSGLLRFKRKFLAPDEITFRIDDTGIVADLVVPRKDEDLIRSLMATGTLGVRPCMLIKESECSRCRQPYEQCACIKVVDPEVKQIITKCLILGAFWTDRAA
jgi:hypothetical protein